MNDPAPNPDWTPLSPQEHHAQLAALSALLGAPPRRVVDLGAGDGRVAAPLAALGHRVLAIDSDDAAVRACAAKGLDARRGDMLAAELEFGFAPDFVLCLGHTFMLLHEPRTAVSMLRRLHALIAPAGAFVIDNFCDPLWDEVASGRWSGGVCEDGAMQLVWARGDNVFALRQGDRVRPDEDALRPDDHLHRLWSRGELALLADAAGWRGPDNDPSGELLLLRPR